MTWIGWPSPGRTVPGVCLNRAEEDTGCSDADAYYRITEEQPTSDGCPRGQRESTVYANCLQPIEPEPR